MTQSIPEDVQITLEANGSGTITIFTRTEGFSWTATSSTLTVTTPGNEVISCNIVSLTSTSCTLTSSNMTFPVVGNIEGEVTITLTKVGGSDNPTPNPDNNYSTLILGTWLLDGLIHNGTDMSNMLPSNIQLSFYANGSGMMSDNGETENNGFNWVINGSTITITPRNGQFTFTIASLTATECSFSGDYLSMADIELRGDIQMHMTKVSNPNPDPDPNPITGSLEGTSWGFVYDTTYSNTEEGHVYGGSVSISLTISFTTTTQGTATVAMAMLTTIDGEEVPEMSQNTNSTSPFTYNYNVDTHSGTITAPNMDREEGEPETFTIPFSYDATRNVIVMTNANQGGNDELPSTIVLTRR